MAGIYIHIPFCKQACNYCNFYFSVSTGLKQQLLQAIIKEIEQTKHLLNNATINTIYFGGGTPSILSADELKTIIAAIHKNHNCNIAELTIEANPDDLTPEKIDAFTSLQPLGLNRFSIGVQSFFDDDLRYMNRAHTSAEASACIKRVQDAGFNLLTIDLIYGTPTLTNERWQQNLETAFALGLKHLSCYALTVEPKTPLHRKIVTQQVIAPNDDISSAQFDILIQQAQQHGFDHYEISNFATPGNYAIHNTNYWKGVPYLGIGPSAHSYFGNTRKWNVSNNKTYIDGILNATNYYEEELLTPTQQANEYIMTSLRTIWGMQLNNSQISPFIQEITSSLDTIDKSLYVLKNGSVCLTNKGKHYADGIAAELFVL